MEKKNKTDKQKDKKVEKKIKKEIKKLDKPKKKKETKYEIDKALVEPFLEDIEEIREKKNKKLLHNLELIVVFVFSIIMLVLLCNRTFFRGTYKNSKIKINIPLLLFFKSDDGNTIVLKTLRKSKYVKEYFDNELNNMTKYNCDGYTFFYDDDNQFAIYNIDVEKDSIVKTITIEYAVGNPDCLCEAIDLGLTGKRAEQLCN